MTETQTQVSEVPTITSMHTPVVALSHYTEKQRRIEIISLYTFALLETYSLITLYNLHIGSFLPLAAILGYLGADFISGFLHWAADTWGNVNWPIFGKSLIRTFREHHIDPKAITHHDFVETNGAISLVAVPLLILANLSLNFSFGPYFFAFIVFQCFFGSITSQVHKWAHLEKHELPSWVRWLQKSRIIMSPEMHVTHHTYPFDTYYCINSGSLNLLFQKIRFFRACEFVIHKLTGQVPREDDMNLHANRKSS